MRVLERQAHHDAGTRDWPVHDADVPVVSSNGVGHDRQAQAGFYGRAAAPALALVLLSSLPMAYLVLRERSSS